MKMTKLFWGPSQLMFPLTLAFCFLYQGLDAQVLKTRIRDRFNVDADGFWMKGKCAIPAGRFGLADDGAIFNDVKVVVKNRRGKRKIRKRRANVDIDIRFFGITRGGDLLTVASASKSCANKKKCKFRTRRITLEQDLGGEDIEIVGMVACISGQRRGRRLTQFSCSVGDIPHSFSINEFCNRIKP